MIKKIILSLLLLLLFVFSGISYSAENPFKGLTREQVIQKYFEGQQLDLIEGIWINDFFEPAIIIKPSRIDFDNKDEYDYLKIEFSSSDKAGITGIRKTQYSSAFRIGNYRLGKGGYWFRFTSPTALIELTGVSYSNCYNVYTRVYPYEVK